jgi:uncharacterized protein YdbL (DUF1318 family)
MLDRFRQMRFTVIFCLLLFAASCVTINIYFPAEKVESVAGEIVQDVRGQRGEIKSPDKGDKRSFFKDVLLAFSPSEAWAQAETSVSNPTIRGLKDRLRSNYVGMKPFYDKGMVREGNDGYVHIGESGGAGLKEKRDLKTMVDAENQTRRQLYEEVARALKIDMSQVGRIAEIFAKEWQKSVR